ncbi:alpha/beta fold hydrolase, partial [Schumannella sp. 10F1B-5-1]
MLQRTGRVTTGDGVELAYAESGTGRPLVYVAGWLGHLDLSWELPEERGYLEALARGRRLVRYDRAGTGLSA